MLDSWSNEDLVVHAITAETPLTLTGGDATVTMGTAGDITTRPMEIFNAVIRDGSTDYPVRLISVAQYAAIPNKTLQSTYPTDLYDDCGYPLRTLTLYPVPAAAKSLVLYTKRALTQIATLDTSLSLPPGYEEALIYNHAMRLAPEYGKTVADSVAMIAMDSKASLKRSNHKASYLTSDSIPAQANRSFNFVTGDWS
jgi:hypothetical protein